MLPAFSPGCMDKVTVNQKVYVRLESPSIEQSIVNHRRDESPDIAMMDGFLRQVIEIDL